MCDVGISFDVKNATLWDQTSMARIYSDDRKARAPNMRVVLDIVWSLQYLLPSFSKSPCYTKYFSYAIVNNYSSSVCLSHA